MNVQLTAESTPNPLPQAGAVRGGDGGADPSAGTPAPATDFASVLGIKIPAAILNIRAAAHGSPAKAAATDPRQASDPNLSALVPTAASQPISDHGAGIPDATKGKPVKMADDAPASPALAMFAPTAPALMAGGGEISKTGSVAATGQPTAIPVASLPHALSSAQTASPTKTADSMPTASAIQGPPPTPTEGMAALVNAATHEVINAQKPLEKPPVADTPAAALPAHLLQSAAPPPAPATAPMVLDIATPLGNAGWDRQLVQQVVWVSNQQHQVADIRINPPQLGPIELRVSLDNQQSGQQATVHFSSPHPEVRDAIEQALPQLREAMAGAGISLGNASVGSESFRGQQAPGQGGSQSSFSSGATPQPAGALNPPQRPVSRGSGLVDTFA